MFHKILVAMDTSVSKSVFDEALALARRRIQSHAATFCPEEKAVQICTFSSLEYYSGLSGKP